MNLVHLESSAYVTFASDDSECRSILDIIQFNK